MATTQRTRVRAVPSSITGELFDYLRDIATAINGMASPSYFSGTNPNSVVTGIAGDQAVNIGSASTSTRLWIKGGDPVIPDQQNWVMVRIAT